MDLMEIRRKCEIQNNSKSVKIACLRNKVESLPQPKELTRLHFIDIYTRLKKANVHNFKQLNTMTDLENAGVKDIQFIVEEFQKWSLETAINPANIQERYNKVNGLLTTIPVDMSK
jgi:hypothetical protein